MRLSAPASVSGTTVATAPPSRPVQAQPHTVQLYSTNSHSASASNLPNPHLQASSGITNSTPRNTPPGPRGRGRPPRARGRQVRPNSTTRPAYNSNVPNSTNPATAAAAVAAGQPSGMMTPEMLLTLQRQHQQHVLVNRQQQQQIMVNRQQQRQVLARQQQQAMMRRQAAASGLAYPTGQQPAIPSSTQPYRATQPPPIAQSYSAMNNQHSQRHGSAHVPANNSVRQKLIVFHNKYKEVFAKISPHFAVYVNAFDESRREAVKKQFMSIHTLFKFAQRPTIPPVVTAQLIDQHATVIENMVSYFKTQAERRNTASNAATASINSNRTSTGVVAAEAKLRQQRLLQAQTQARLRAQQQQQQAQIPVQPHTQQEARVRIKSEANLQTSTRPQQNQGIASSSAVPNVQSPARLQSTTVRNLPVANRNGTHVGVTKPTKLGTHSSTAAKKKVLNTIHMQAERIFKRADDTAKNAEKLLIFALKTEKAMKLERVRNTLQALQRMVSVRKKRNAAKVKNETIVKQKTSFVFSNEGGMGIVKEDLPNLKSLRGRVEADCDAAKSRNSLLDLEILEEFGSALIECQLLIEEIKLPKLILRVKKGYPESGTVTYAFERPPLGWVGIVAEIHNRFKKELEENMGGSSASVTAILDGWARVAKEVVDTEFEEN